MSDEGESGNSRIDWQPDSEVHGERYDANQDDASGENPTGENPAGENPTGENPNRRNANGNYDAGNMVVYWEISKCLGSFRRVQLKSRL